MRVKDFNTIVTSRKDFHTTIRIITPPPNRLSSRFKFFGGSQVLCSCGKPFYFSRYWVVLPRFHLASIASLCHFPWLSQRGCVIVLSMCPGFPSLSRRIRAMTWRLDSWGDARVWGSSRDVGVLLLSISSRMRLVIERSILDCLDDGRVWILLLILSPDFPCPSPSPLMRLIVLSEHSHGVKAVVKTLHSWEDARVWGSYRDADVLLSISNRM